MGQQTVWSKATGGDQVVANPYGPSKDRGFGRYVALAVPTESTECFTVDAVPLQSPEKRVPGYGWRGLVDLINRPRDSFVQVLGRIAVLREDEQETESEMMARLKQAEQKAEEK